MGVGIATLEQVIIGRLGGLEGREGLRIPALEPMIIADIVMIDRDQAGRFALLEFVVYARDRLQDRVGALRGRAACGIVRQDRRGPMEARGQCDPGPDGCGVLGDQSFGQCDRLASRFDRRGEVAPRGLDPGQHLIGIEPLQLGSRVPLEVAHQGQRLAGPRIDQCLAVRPELFRGQGVVFGTDEAIDGTDGSIA